MKVLVTGGCGFLGSNIAAEMLADGHEVVVIDALFRKGGEQNLEWLTGQADENRFKFYKYDLAKEREIFEVFEKEGGFEYICHLGGQVAMTTSLQDPRRDLMTNIIGTFNVLEAARKYCPDTFVAYSSTNKVYGDLIHLEYTENDLRYSVEGYPEGFDESLKLDFASPYGCSKGGADQYVHDWFRNFGLKTVVFRHSSIYGGRQFSTFDQGWVGWFCQKALEQKSAETNGLAVAPFTIQGSGKQVRDVLHARDLVSLYKKAYNKKDIVAGKVFNIGGGIDNSLSLLQLFKLLEDLLEIKGGLLFERLERRKSDQDFFVANINLARELLDWRPEVSCRDGVTEMLNWSQSMTQGG